jgi:hypothetical protein
LPGDANKQQQQEQRQESDDDEEQYVDAMTDSASDVFSMDLHSVVRSTRKKSNHQPSRTPHASPLKELRPDETMNIKHDLTDMKHHDTWESSIHLSEFEQPPRSTSTPNKGILESSIQKPTNLFSTPLRETPFNKRPPGYSTPLFKFDTKSFDRDIHDTQEPIFHDSNESVFGSPLAHKSKQDMLKDEVNQITNKMKDSLNIKNNSTIDTNISYLNEADLSLLKSPDISNFPMVDVQSITPKPILKKDTGKAKKKSVRIDDSIKLIQDGRKKRPQSTNSITPDTPRNKRKKRVTHKVNPNTEYDNFRKICGDERDPLDIILHE